MQHAQSLIITYTLAHNHTMLTLTDGALWATSHTHTKWTNGQALLTEDGSPRLLMGPVHLLSGLFRLYAWEFVYMGFPCISSSAVSGDLSNTMRKTIAAFFHRQDCLAPPNLCRSRPIAKIDEFVYMGFRPFARLAASGDLITSVRTTIVAFMHQPDSLPVPNSAPRSKKVAVAVRTRPYSRPIVAFHAC